MLGWSSSVPCIRLYIVAARQPQHRIAACHCTPLYGTVRYCRSAAATSHTTTATPPPPPRHLLATSTGPDFLFKCKEVLTVVRVGGPRVHFT